MPHCRAYMACDIVTFMFIAPEITDFDHVVFGLRSSRSSPLRMGSATADWS